MAVEYSIAGALTFKTASDITYDRAKDGGSDLARKGLWVEISGDNEVQMLTAGGTPLGQLLEVFGDNTCSVCVEGLLTGLQGAVGGVSLGKGVMGAVGPSVGGQTNGYLAVPGNTVAAATAQRGLVTEILSNTAGGEILVLLGGG